MFFKKELPCTIKLQYKKELSCTMKLQYIFTYAKYNYINSKNIIIIIIIIITIIIILTKQ